MYVHVHVHVHVCMLQCCWSPFQLQTLDWVTTLKYSRRTAQLTIATLSVARQPTRHRNCWDRSSMVQKWTFGACENVYIHVCIHTSSCSPLVHACLDREHSQFNVVFNLSKKRWIFHEHTHTHTHMHTIKHTHAHTHTCTPHTYIHAHTHTQHNTTHTQHTDNTHTHTQTE